MLRAVIVVGKAPVAGQTKTRLVPPLDPDGAAALYRGFLLDTLRLAARLGWERTSLVHPAGHGRALCALAQGVQLIEQPRDGLGAALAYAFERHFGDGYGCAILIGSDNPTLPESPIRAAEAELRGGADLAIGPTTDGGYYLIGMRQPHLGVFERIDWSTSRVYAQTLDRAHRLNLRVKTVQEWYDVDEPTDLERLQRELASGPPTLAPNTRAALREPMRVARAQ